MRSHHGKVVHLLTANRNGAPVACGESRDPRRRTSLEVDDVTCARCIRSNYYKSLHTPRPQESE